MKTLTKYIPKANPDYHERVLADGDVVLGNEQTVLEMFHKDSVNLLLVGDASTGKNTAIDEFGARKNLPVIVIPFNGASTPESVLGQTVVDKDGKFKWSDGFLVQVAREGGIIVLDEINFCPQDIAGALHDVLANRRLTLTDKDGGEVIHLHKNCWIVATMNPPEYEGTRELNLAFEDRFQILRYDYNEEFEKNLLKDDKFYEIVKRLRESYQEGEIEKPVTTRMLLRFVNNRKVFGVEQAKTLFTWSYKPKERIAVKELLELC